MFIFLCALFFNFLCGMSHQGYRRKLKLLIGKINTNICEQVFSWVRNFAPILNEMRPNRHRFCLLSLARRHNISISKGETNYLHLTRRNMNKKI